MEEFQDDNDNLKTKAEEARAKAYSNTSRITRLEKHQRWIVEALVGTILLTMIILKLILIQTFGIE